MFEMIDKSERERDIKAADRGRIQIVNGEAAKLEVETENFANEEGLANMLPLAVDAENAMRAAPFRFDAIKAAVASDIEHALARQSGRQTLLDQFPGFARMIDRLAHHALSLRENSVAEIDPVKPRLENS